MRGAVQVGEIVNGDHMIMGHLATDLKCTLVSKHSDHDHMTAGMARTSGNSGKIHPAPIVAEQMARS